MDAPDPRREAHTTVQEVLGYLNFSSGAPDARFQHNFDVLANLAPFRSGVTPWVPLRQWLLEELDELQRSGGDSFRDIEQARSVLELALGPVLAAYRDFHRDLLFHQRDVELFQPYFLARVCEAVLRQGAPWNDRERLIAGAVAELNDFIGYRPVAVLHSRQKIEPYAHEWVCPIPLYFRGAGVAQGPYHAVVSQALAILESTPEGILRQAWFEPANLDELALDPRAYDFDHPVSKRPNHQFGQWDPHHIDNRGHYRRFVLQEVTLEAIWQRTQHASHLPECERLYEAGAVLAGVILMASAISGFGPETHDSSVTLSKLVPKIAAFRDAFYERLIAQVSGPHGTRLREEAANLRQPFGGARQHLNQRLARLRATQLQHVHLAQLFARLGYPDASSRQAQIVPVASARMLCEISCRLTGAHHALDKGEVASAAILLGEIEDLLDRAIHCGALVDPWNMLGFQGQFSLFPTLENSVHDHRVDVLAHLVRSIFALYARAQGEAAAAGNRELRRQFSRGLAKRAEWWDQFASAEVSNIERVRGAEARASAEQVSEALGAWHDAGEAAGDIGFWRKHVADFQSPKAYALVLAALFEKHDLVAARALLMQWLSRQEEIELSRGSESFHALAERWLAAVEQSPPSKPGLSSDEAATERWQLIERFFDHLEANAEGLWEVPRFEWTSPGGTLADELTDGPVEEDEETDGLYGAAYEHMTYRDSTADGVEGETLEGGSLPTDFELDAEARRLGQRLEFLATVARIWRLAAAGSFSTNTGRGRADVFGTWAERALKNHGRLLELLAAVSRHRIPAPSTEPTSLVEYDRRRLLKEHLLQQIINTAVDMSAAVRMTLAAAGGNEASIAKLVLWQQRAVPVLAALWRGDATVLRGLMPDLLAALDEQPVLYVPLARHGDPQRICAVRDVHLLLQTLLNGLPRLGLLAETCQLVATIQTMERHRPEREGAITEFDRLFEIGYLAMVECVIVASDDSADGNLASDADLIEGLQWLSEPMLTRWLEHSRSLRLSVLEKLQQNKQRWPELVSFIERYGHDLFTPQFLNLGNLRAILHRGAGNWLSEMEAEREHTPDDELSLLVRELGTVIKREEAVAHLQLVLEALVEHYAEYKDYNSTTTQSDRGEMLHVLLDFLRLLSGYDRVAWNIRPLVMAHQALVRRGKMAAAELWRRALAQRTGDVADWHLKRLTELTKQYGVRLPTVADRLDERFVRPLAVDRIRALVRPAIEEKRRGDLPIAFELLEQEIDDFTEQPVGSGLDVPPWLLGLEEEADEALGARTDDDNRPEQLPIPRVHLTWAEVQSQLKSWEPG